MIFKLFLVSILSTSFLQAQISLETRLTTKYFYSTIFDPTTTSVADTVNTKTSVETFLSVPDKTKTAYVTQAPPTITNVISWSKEVTNTEVISVTKDETVSQTVSATVSEVISETVSKTVDGAIFTIQPVLPTPSIVVSTKHQTESVSVIVPVLPTSIPLTVPIPVTIEETQSLTLTLSTGPTWTATLDVPWSLTVTTDIAVVTSVGDDASSSSSDAPDDNAPCSRNFTLPMDNSEVQKHYYLMHSPLARHCSVTEIASSKEAYLVSKQLCAPAFVHSWETNNYNETCLAIYPGGSAAIVPPLGGCNASLDTLCS